MVFKMVGRLYERALEAGANCIVVSCQMCQANLDVYQDKIGEEMGITVDLPIIYFTELIGLAMKERDVENWLSRHFVDPIEFLSKQNLLTKL
jgi:heterodisulfide reductase subunit B